MTDRLPVEQILPDLLAALRTHGCAVLTAPPGAGKTTKVPPAILNEAFLDSRQILMLEPRRIAARTAAARMATERGERVGQTVGFRVRFEEAVSRHTRILVVTEGVLLRRLQDDPFLENIGVLIFDEFHERRLDSDLALAMARRVRNTVRPDLKIIAMSATMAPEPIAAFLDRCPIIHSEGRQYPVRVRYITRADRRPLHETMAEGIEGVVQNSAGHILAFLPGLAEIHRTRDRLEATAQRHNLLLLPLYGDLPSGEQDRVLAPTAGRKVILATNVAETSITIDGVETVVDSGLARQMQFDPSAGLDRLELTPISRASADQRAGRAGRTRPGACLRLWDESSHRSRPATDQPEILRVDLSSAILRLKAWGETEIAGFPWFEPPSAEAIEHALRLLHLLGALQQNTITDLGRSLVRFPASPRIARLLLEAAASGAASRACLLAALLAERDPFIRSPDPRRGNSGQPIHTRTLHNSRSDVLDRLHAVERWLEHGQTYSEFGEIHRGAAQSLTQAARQFHSILRDEITPTPVPPSQSSAPDAATRIIDEPDEILLKSLAAGFPDRLARRRDSGGDRALMVGGRGVRLSPKSSVRNAALFLCIDVDNAGTDAEVRQASEVLRSWLPKSLLAESEELFFHPSQKQVVARRRLSFADLILEETPVAITSADVAADVLYKAAVTQLNAVLPTDHEPLSTFLERARFLRKSIPELDLPAFDDSTLHDVLRSLCHGRRSFEELKAAPWLPTLQSTLNYSQLQLLEREAPERIEVPSGSRIRLEYAPDRPPVLAVRIQEIFGLQQTPRVARGRVPVLLHLLGPNFRPQQITDDLASFWVNTYPEVRRELKRRYPKHSWPEEPATAQAIRKG
ncbi:MAG: ATP-dependent helicase HrpB [Planctomycetota bacterium]